MRGAGNPPSIRHRYIRFMVYGESEEKDYHKLYDWRCVICSKLLPTRQLKTPGSKPHICGSKFCATERNRLYQAAHREKLQQEGEEKTGFKFKHFQCHEGDCTTWLKVPHYSNQTICPSCKAKRSVATGKKAKKKVEELG